MLGGVDPARVRGISWGEKDTGCWAVWVAVEGGPRLGYACESEPDARSLAERIARWIASRTGREIRPTPA